jgi:hypothetical protein
MLYPDETFFGAINISGGWPDAKALLAIPDGG